MSKGRESPGDAEEWDERTRDLYDLKAPPIPYASDTTAPGTTRQAGGEPRGSSDGGTYLPATDEASELKTRIRSGGPGGPMTQGRTLFDKYQVVRRLGEGGMGEVWLVRHLDLDAERALKLIISAVSFNDEHRARFRREARVMARFSHPNAVTVHDAVVRPDGNTAYIEMEYVRGRSLKDVLVPGVPMSLDWTAQIVAQLCGVLQVAHENGIVHRDLKPSNLMLLDGQAPGKEHLKVLDFGIAKLLSLEETDPEGVVSRTGTPLGTPMYMSPEQIIANPKEINARSDLYAVGVILYELLTGHRVFEGNFHKLIYQHLHASPAPFAERNPDVHIPPEVERVVVRCLNKDPRQRPASMRALADEFHRAAYPDLPSLELPRGTRGGWRPAGATLAIVLVGLLAGAVAWWARPPSFTLRAMPATLRLHAGESRTVTVELTRDRLKGPAPIRPGPVPDGIRVSQESTAGPDAVQFQVEADLNRRPDAGHARLSFVAVSGRNTKTTTVELAVDPPVFNLPPRCTLLPGSKFDRLGVGGKIYLDRVGLVVPPLKRGQEPITVVFLLIKKNRPDDPEPFYIMETKVWNALFTRFVDEIPKSVDDNPVWQAITYGKHLPESAARLPALEVTAREAHRFAEWLGGRLPTCRQWDKAAGLFDPVGLIGPFLGTWKPGETDGIAVGRDVPGQGPLPVGTAARDISPFGCRDMAGNGNEWTRNSSLGNMIPLALYSNEMIHLRGRTYRDSSPLLYEDLKKDSRGDDQEYRQRSDETGFRIVLEGL